MTLADDMPAGRIAGVAMSEPQFDDAFRNELEQLFRWRRDVRRFRREALPDGLLEILLDTAQLSPSVGLSEPWRWVAVDDPVRRDAVRTIFKTCNAAALASQTQERASLYARLKLAGLEEAPVHLAVFSAADPQQGGGLGRKTMPETTAYSTVIAIHTLWLAARAAGVGLGWVSILDPPAVAAALDVPSDWTFVGYLCLGYPEITDDTPELERARWERRSSKASLIPR